MICLVFKNNIYYLSLINSVLIKPKNNNLFIILLYIFYVYYDLLQIPNYEIFSKKNTIFFIIGK